MHLPYASKAGPKASSIVGLAETSPESIAARINPPSFQFIALSRAARDAPHMSSRLSLDRRDARARAQPVEIAGPRIHHRATLGQVLRAVVSILDRVRFLVRKLSLD